MSFMFAGAMTSPHATGVGAHHRLPHFTAERLLKFGHVLDHAVYSKTSRRMGVDFDQGAGALRSNVFAPQLREAHKKPLLRREVILLRRLAADGTRHKRHQRDANAAIISGV